MSRRYHYSMEDFAADVNVIASHGPLGPGPDHEEIEPAEPEIDTNNELLEQFEEVDEFNETVSEIEAGQAEISELSASLESAQTLRQQIKTLGMSMSAATEARKLDPSFKVDMTRVTSKRSSSQQTVSVEGLGQAIWNITVRLFKAIRRQIMRVFYWILGKEYKEPVDRDINIISAKQAFEVIHATALNKDIMREALSKLQKRSASASSATTALILLNRKMTKLADFMKTYTYVGTSGSTTWSGLKDFFGDDSAIVPVLLGTDGFNQALNDSGQFSVSRFFDIVKATGKIGVQEVSHLKSIQASLFNTILHEDAVIDDREIENVIHKLEGVLGLSTLEDMIDHWRNTEGKSNLDDVHVFANMFDGYIDAFSDVSESSNAIVKLISEVVDFDYAPEKYADILKNVDEARYSYVLENNNRIISALNLLTRFITINQMANIELDSRAKGRVMAVNAAMVMLGSRSEKKDAIFADVRKECDSVFDALKKLD